jgi:hypothetical protein
VDVLPHRCGRFVSLVLSLTVFHVAQAGAQPAESGGARLTGSVSVGFDSFQEKYSIVDRDTLDSVNEFWTRATLGLLTGTFLRDYLLLEGRVQYGDDTYESGGRIKFTKRFLSRGPRVGFEGYFDRKLFGKNSSYHYPNDYDRAFLFGYVKQSLGSSFAVRITDRLEIQDFKSRTEFDYDYKRNKLSIAGEFDWQLTTFLDMAVTHVVMDVPDSTEIEYQSFIQSVDFRHFAGLYDRLNVLAALERREYVSGSPRSSFWAVLGSMAGEHSVAQRLSLLLESELEWYQYDFKNPVYFDYVENRTALLLNVNYSYGFRFGAGPAFGFLASDVSDADEYSEWGAKFALEYNRGTRAWFSFAYEPGNRTYKAFGDDRLDQEFSLFSDYTYHRISLFGNFRILKYLSFSGFIDYQPEDHKKEGDDATATLISFSLNSMF